MTERVESSPPTMVRAKPKGQRRKAPSLERKPPRSGGNSPLLKTKKVNIDDAPSEQAPNPPSPPTSIPALSFSSEDVKNPVDVNSPSKSNPIKSLRAQTARKATGAKASLGELLSSGLRGHKTPSPCVSPAPSTPESPRGDPTFHKNRPLTPTEQQAALDQFLKARVDPPPPTPPEKGGRSRKSLFGLSIAGYALTSFLHLFRGVLTNRVADRRVRNHFALILLVVISSRPCRMQRSLYCSSCTIRMSFRVYWMPLFIPKNSSTPCSRFS